MTTRKRRITAVAVLAAGAVALSGCAAGGSGGSEGGLEGEITFQTWNLKNDKFTPYFEELIATFEDENPGASIEWVDAPAEGYQDKLSADAAAGSLPDVVDMGPEAAYTLAQAGILEDVSTDSGASDLYLDKAWEAMTFEGLGGGTYGYPWYLNTGPSFFNTELLTDCGLDASDLPATYDDLFAQAEELAQACPDASMIARMPAIENFGEYGVDLISEDGTEFIYNSPEGVEFVQRFVDLYAEAGLTAESLNNLQTAEVDEFKAGRLGYLPGSSYTYGDLQDTAPDVFDALGIGERINEAAPNMYIESLVVNATSDRPDLAKEFAKYVTNDANQLEFAKAASVFPSSAGTLDDPYFTEDDGDGATAVRLQSAEQVREAVVWWPAAFSGAADVGTLREQIAQAVLGQKTAHEALDASVAYSNERLATSR